MTRHERSLQGRVLLPAAPWVYQTTVHSVGMPVARCAWRDTQLTTPSSNIDIFPKFSTSWGRRSNVNRRSGTRPDGRSPTQVRHLFGQTPRQSHPSKARTSAMRDSCAHGKYKRHDPVHGSGSAVRSGIGPGGDREPAQRPDGGGRGDGASLRRALEGWIESADPLPDSRVWRKTTRRKLRSLGYLK